MCDRCSDGFDSGKGVSDNVVPARDVTNVCCEL